ncbi:hypothetical protein KAU45_04790 [bacterium]|nr:hypothetical protein [bacterium]
MKDEKKEKILPLPKFLAKYRPNNPNDVCIDIGIVDTIRHLWSHKIETLGSCSGHGKANPSIVVADEYSIEEILKIRSLIKDVDAREWDIYQWQVVRIQNAFPH